MKRLQELGQRRAALAREIELGRLSASSAAAALRTDIGAALLGVSVARLFGGGIRLRGLAGIAAGALAAFAARSLARNLSEDRKTS